MSDNVYPETKEEKELFGMITAGNCPDCFHESCEGLVGLALQVIDARRKAAA